MKKSIVTIFLCWCVFHGFGQQALSGIVLSDKATPVEFGTVALLKPSDSTLLYFGITNASGNFEIKSVAGGNYVLQISFIGYNTYDTVITVPNGITIAVDKSK